MKTTTIPAETTNIGTFTVQTHAGSTLTGTAEMTAAWQDTVQRVAEMGKEPVYGAVFRVNSNAGGQVTEIVSIDRIDVIGFRPKGGR